MDLQRSLLIGAIAVLSFMLLTEWVAFKDARNSEATQGTERLTSQTAPAAAPELPEAPTAESADLAEDIPVAPTEEASDQVTPEVTATDSGRIVQVYTDVLQLAIDLQGGDIVELALPEHLAELGKTESPFVLLERNDTRTYIAQSGLIGADGIDSGGRPTFSTTASRFTLEDGKDSVTVDLTYPGENGVKITKRFTFRRGDYLVDVDYLVQNGSAERWQANLFGQIKRDSSPAPATDNAGMGLQPFLGAALTQPDERFTKFSFDDMAEEPFKAQLPGGWIAMIQHYFLSAWIPNAEQSHTYSTRVTRGGYNIAGFTSPATMVDPGQSATVSAQFYAGPKDQYRLEEISPYLLDINFKCSNVACSL